MCYGRYIHFKHDHWTCPSHKPNKQTYKKGQGLRKRAPANIWETNLKVSKDEFSEFEGQAGEGDQKIERSRVPQQNKEKDNKKEKNNKSKGRWRKNGDGVNEVTTEENTATNNASWRSP